MFSTCRISFLPLSTVLVLLLFFLDPTRATWSILAIDKRTHQIGSALATCLDKDATPADAANILTSSFAATPCRGAILAVAQANVQDSTGPTQSVGAPLLEADYGKVPEAQAIINAMVTNLADPGSIVFQTSENSNNNGGGNNNDILLPLFDIRQYGVVTYSDTDPVASYTGPQLSFLYEAFGVEDTEEVSLTAESDDFVVSAQGNIVAPGTVAATMDAFLTYNGTISTAGSNNNINTTDSCDNNTPRDDFAERLLYSLKQGYSATGIGDVRCVGHPASKGAVLAYLKILDPSTGDYVVNLESSIGLASSTIVNTNITTIVNGTTTTIVTPGAEARPTITFNVDGSNGNFSAVDAIEADLGAWRETHPVVCLSNGEASSVCANRTNLPDYEEESTVPTSAPTAMIVTSGAPEFGDTRMGIAFGAGLSALALVATIF